MNINRFLWNFLVILNLRLSGGQICVDKVGQRSPELPMDNHRPIEIIQEAVMIKNDSKSIFELDFLSILNVSDKIDFWKP